MRFLCAGLVLLSGVAHAWGPATHYYLTDRATECTHPEVLFGSMLADMNQAVFDKPEIASSLRRLTHFEFDRLAPSCLTLAIASHNDVWGADWFAHQYWRPETPENVGLYSTQKIRQIAEERDISDRAAEFYFEMAIDYLLRVDEGPDLGRRIQWSAASFRRRHEQLLVDAFAAPLAADVPELSLAAAEAEVIQAARLFQTAMLTYGGALAEDHPGATRIALAAMGVAYLGVTLPTALEHLDYAVELCRHDYRIELNRIADILTERLTDYAPEQMEQCCVAFGCMPQSGKSHPASAAPLMALGLLLAPRLFRRGKATV